AYDQPDPCRTAAQEDASRECGACAGDRPETRGDSAARGGGARADRSAVGPDGAAAGAGADAGVPAVSGAAHAVRGSGADGGWCTDRAASRDGGLPLRKAGGAGYELTAGRVVDTDEAFGRSNGREGGRAGR